MEHRWGIRAACSFEARLQCRGQAPSSGTLCDISLSGGFVRAGMRPPVSSRIVLSVAGLELEGWIVRCVSTGFAMEWNPDSLAGVIGLLARIHGSAPDPLPGVAARGLAADLEAPA